MVFSFSITRLIICTLDAFTAPVSSLFPSPLHTALSTHSRPLSTLLSPLSSTLCPLPSPRRRQLMKWKCHVVVKVRGWIACPDAFYLTISLSAGAGRRGGRGGRGGHGGRRGPTRTGGWCLFTDPPLTLSTHSKSPLSFLFSPPLSALSTQSRPLSTLLSPLSSTLCPLPSP